MDSPENIITTTTATTAAISAATLSSDTVSIQGQQHCSMHGHNLRLEEAQSNILAKSPDFQSPSIIVTSSGLLASPAALEVFESSCPEESATSSCEKLINLTQPIISMSAARNSENSRSIVSKPSGIGLQLDSIINAMPIGCAATGGMVSAEKHYLNIEWRKVVSIMGCHQPEILENCSISNVKEKVSANSEDGVHETQASVATNLIVSQPPQFVKHSNDPALLKQCEYQTIPCDKRKSTFEHSDYQSSPERISKKPLETNDGEGCKHCNCKKTKCLKLYCDCFAAGIYCDESCTCQNCFNRPEYEDTVLESRQQIESRNPFAFSPKVVKHVTDIPATSYVEERNNATLSSSRHKRGCNCKKSMCLKKYCECYQANVGCFHGCRCEGCQNVHGRKEEYDVTKDMSSRGLIHEKSKNIFDEEQETVSSQDVFLPKLCNPHNMTPLMPSFQFLHHGNDAPRYQFSTHRSHQSPESNLTFFPPYEKLTGSSGNSDNYEMLVEARKEIEDVAYCHQEWDFSNAETVDQLSPRYGLASVFNLSRLPSSVSSTISRAPLCPGSGHLSSMNSIYWHGLPNTTVSQFCGSNLCEGVDPIEEHNILEDDMPQTLKDISTPVSTVQVSSPDRKRVSSPHSSVQVPGSSSSLYPSSFNIMDSKETKYK